MAELGKPAVPISSSPERMSTGEALRPSPFLEAWHKPVFIGCLLCWVGNLTLSTLQIDHSPVGRWFEGLFLLFATGSTLIALGRRVPLQNVLATAVLITLISAAVISLTAVTGIPLGPVHYSAYLGEKVFDILPWPFPLAWILFIVNGRGIARLI